ncbi:Ret finger protein-like 4B [Pteropus alecto]|uniref:Ret finger protein-like 4B n=1 Tax=Pteropus alecto TaxID=9402 RepID=L5JP03_PTEAL|nr:Ret finger protein-like 4B [Pteropus alecto]
MSASLREEATCPVCLELFSNPISLSCVHTFCYDCIQLWLLERKDMKLTCPICREVTDKAPLEEWQIRTLTLLTQQHGFLLEQSLHMRKEFLKFREDMTLDAVTANSRLVLSNDLRKVQCGKICHDLVDDPQRFTHMACVLGTSCFSSGYHYWEVEVEDGKDWALGSQIEIDCFDQGILCWLKGCFCGEQVGGTVDGIRGGMARKRIDDEQ